MADEDEQASEVHPWLAEHVGQPYEGETQREYLDRINKEARARYRATYPGNWLQRWIRDEAFWKDITVNVVSGLIVAFLIVFLAVAAGYVKPWMLAAIATLPILVLGLAMTGLRLRREESVWQKIVGHLQTAATMIVLLVGVWGGAWLLSFIWH